MRFLLSPLFRCKILTFNILFVEEGSKRGVNGLEEVFSMFGCGHLLCQFTPCMICVLAQVRSCAVAHRCA